MDETKELPKRKTLRLQGLDYTTAGAYFITVCTKGRKLLFSPVGADSISARNPHARLPTPVGANCVRPQSRHNLTINIVGRDVPDAPQASLKQGGFFISHPPKNHFHPITPTPTLPKCPKFVYFAHKMTDFSLI